MPSLELCAKLNAVVREHYPEGEVNYTEVIRSSMALATAYQRSLEARLPQSSNEIAETVKSICEWMQTHKH